MTETHLIKALRTAQTSHCSVFRLIPHNLGTEHEYAQQCKCWPAEVCLDAGCFLTPLLSRLGCRPVSQSFQRSLAQVQSLCRLILKQVPIKRLGSSSYLGFRPRQIKAGDSEQSSSNSVTVQHLRVTWAWLLMSSLGVSLSNVSLSRCKSYSRFLFAHLKLHMRLLINNNGFQSRISICERDWTWRWNFLAIIKSKGYVPFVSSALFSELSTKETRYGDCFHLWHEERRLN